MVALDVILTQKFRFTVNLDEEDDDDFRKWMTTTQMQYVTVTPSLFTGARNNFLNLSYN